MRIRSFALSPSGSLAQISIDVPGLLLGWDIQISGNANSAATVQQAVLSRSSDTVALGTTTWNSETPFMDIVQQQFITTATTTTSIGKLRILRSAIPGGRLYFGAYDSGGGIMRATLTLVCTA